MMYAFLLKVPCNPENYVKEVYGDQWFKPQKKWDFLVDSKNTRQTLPVTATIYHNNGITRQAFKRVKALNFTLIHG